MLICIAVNLLISKHRTLKTLESTLYNLKHTKPMSQPTSIPKKQQRLRDHGFDNYMEIEKKTRKVLKVSIFNTFSVQPNTAHFTS
jgi:hypothetical protein